MNHGHEEIEGENELRELLGDLKLSIDAWSESSYHRPRVAQAKAAGLRWQMALSGAVGLLTVAAVATVSLQGGHRPMRASQPAVVQAPATSANPETAKTTAQDAAVAEIEARIPGIKRIPASIPTLGQMVSSPQREEEDLLARVDSEVARETPSAMEPLARLMAEDEAR